MWMFVSFQRVLESMTQGCDIVGPQKTVNQSTLRRTPPSDLICDCEHGGCATPLALVSRTQQIITKHRMDRLVGWSPTL